MTPREKALIAVIRWLMRALASLAMHVVRDVSANQRILRTLREARAMVKTIEEAR
jgi:hypothetical protein